MRDAVQILKLRHPPASPGCPEPFRLEGLIMHVFRRAGARSSHRAAIAEGAENATERQVCRRALRCPEEHKVFSAQVRELSGAACRIAPCARSCASWRIIALDGAGAVMHRISSRRRLSPPQRPAGKGLLVRSPPTKPSVSTAQRMDGVERRDAARDGGFRVSARKPFGSGAPQGGLLVTSARFDDPRRVRRLCTLPFPSPTGRFARRRLAGAGDAATGSRT